MGEHIKRIQEVFISETVPRELQSKKKMEENY